MVKKQMARPVVGLVWLVCSLALPPLLVAVGLGPVLLLLVLLGTAAAIRTGGVLLDRLAVALLLLCGEVLLLGLLMSVWPWGLSVPLSCSVLLLVAGLWWWFAGRLPQLPLRFRYSDLAVVGTGAFVFWRLMAPVAGLSPAAQLNYNGEAPDAYVHFAIFDAIQRIPGFLFLHTVEARQYVMTPTESSYPQGSHFLFAWVQLVLRNGKLEPDALVSFTWLFHAMLAAAALLCALTVWGARWVGGPRLRGWRAGAVCGLVGGLLLTSPLVLLVVQGFYSELVGLLFVVLGTALMLRSAMPMAERAAVVVATAVATAYCYNLFLVFFGFLLVAHVVLQRRRIGAAIRWWLPVVALGLAAAALPTLISVTTALNVSTQSMQQGAGASTQSLMFQLALTVVVLAALVRPALRGFAVARAGFLLAAGTAVALTLYGAYQYQTLHHLAYYFEKSATGATFAMLVLLGAVGWALRASLSAPALRFGGKRAGRLVTASLGLAAGFGSLLVGLNADWGVDVGAKPAAAGRSILSSSLARMPLMAWSQRRITATPPTPGGGVVTHPVVLSANGTIIMLDTSRGWSNRRNTLLANTLVHRQGSVVGMNSDLSAINMGSWLPKGAAYRHSLDALVLAVRSEGHQPVEVYVGDRKLAERLAHDLPPLVKGAEVTVAYLPSGSAGT
ncbi:hypothetical protein ABIA32_001496 [Streptacidiphilus sp. MAP12-20]|uniref:hypothetical protein n=1 Tax=Streptacidiphilus sp. MAP12-20 TaxID=3156299 RepID=UPI00351238CF